MSFDLPGLPPLRWTGEPGRATFAEGTLELVASAGVDWSNDATGGPAQQRATALAFETPGQFSLSARVSVVPPRSTFDAAALALWADRDHWAKLCFEFSPHGQAMVVSVVTNDYSDDVNSVLVPRDSVWLRIVRVGPAWAFHASSDGQRWEFVRLFRLATELPVQAGFLAQAPLGQRCEARFDRIALSDSVPRDLRDGS
jgi:regulation of enolase protein 1 (concanavalin A-like superfamily)